MSTKEDKILIQNVWESKKYRVKRLIRNFQTRNEAIVVLMTFRSDCEQQGPLNEHPVVDVRALLRTLTLWGTWFRASRINPKHTAPPTRQISRELGIPQTNNWRWLFLFSFAMNVNEQRIIAFLTEKCYLNLRSTVCTQLRWCGKFYYSCM